MGIVNQPLPGFTGATSSFKKPEQTQAMKELEDRKKIKKKFGVTFHKDMDIKSISNQWLKGVAKNPNIIKKNPEIAGTMTALAITVVAQDAVAKATTIAKKIYFTVKEAVEVASASMTFQFQHPSALATSKASEITATVQTQLTDTATEQAIELLTKVPAELSDTKKFT